MKKNGILNSDISKVLADLGHTNQIMIGDCGLPIPDNVKKINHALEIGEPAFSHVLTVILKEMQVEESCWQRNQREQPAAVKRNRKNNGKVQMD
ncbi:MAG: RbsD/FucU domain-containing protein [Alkalibacterium sp.]|nr:RbsD/FucU domain-containing protein [Alkalibacterium sp.]